MPLAPGLYERLITAELDRALATHADVERAPLHKSEAARVIARHLADYLTRALGAVPEDDQPAAQIAIANQLLETLAKPLASFVDAGDALRPEVLLAVGVPPTRPELPLSESALYVNARRERRLGLALGHEIASADRIDLICAFLGWEGYRELRDAIDAHCRSGRPMRVLTTTYRGITDARVIEALLDVGAEVRISYRSDATRLHAKAWLFHRDSGYSTGYIGSSNLSRSALTSGLEWNVRVSEIENRAVVDEFRGAFGGYWADPEFEPYNAERFAREVKAERPDLTSLAVFELRARPFQQQILDRLHAERELHDRHKHLVVAATGTGKTVVAALDYQALAAASKARPSLLFIAHRREILAQSLDTFRHALSDASFGERLVDNRRPVEWRHVFASVQSLANEDVASWPRDRFDVVIVDEFHHAEGETYQRLLRHLQPRELLGLTATPERADGASILHWFDGRITAELRLWDAIDRGLLVPFRYFAVHDVVSLQDIRWTRGRLDQRALEGVYTAHDARAHHIVRAVRDHVHDPKTMRALAFCVGVEHAAYMTAAFNRAGIHARSVTGATPRAERDRAIADLRDGAVQCLCTVDVFNEGVDIPEIDTVLFLRPTESATVFLQQLGRGLRRAPGKRSLTVLDFVAEASREFRYDVRYRALLGGAVGRGSLKQQIAQDFPYLPSGCVIQLDRVSKEVVLDNVGHSLRLDRRSLVTELKALGPVDLATFLAETQLDLPDLYRGGRTFTELQRAAGFDVPTAGPKATEDKLTNGLGRLLHVDDRARLRAWTAALAGAPAATEAAARLRLMLATTLFGRECDDLDALALHPALTNELSQLLALLDQRLDHTVLPFRHAAAIPLATHARYRLSEVMSAFADRRNGQLYVPREGEYFHAASACNLLFVTLHKDEDDYSPTTMYRDYALGPSRFHWQSQNATRPTDKKGQRHIEHVARGVTPLLFLRERKHDERGESMPYVFLGPLRIAAWSGERPINIEWDLEHPMPADVLRTAAVVA